MALGVEFVASSYHLNEFSTPELEIDVFIVAKSGGIVGRGVFERFVDVAVNDRCADFWDVLIPEYFEGFRVAYFAD